MSTSLQSLIQSLKSAQSFLLSTHRESDGDGLGAQIALYHALKKAGKTVRILNVDRPAERYNFLDPDKIIQVYEGLHEPIAKTDMALIFDTNDRRLIDPLYSQMEIKCKTIVFIDHHPHRQEGPQPTSESVIQMTAASTGEIVYDIIQALNIDWDRPMALALYTAVSFDTQIFRYIRNSPRSHLIAADLLRFDLRPEEIHRALFGRQTVEKMQFLAAALQRLEFLADGRIAILFISEAELQSYNLDVDASKDLVDFIMSVDTLQIAALIREDNNKKFKVSLRSKGSISVLPAAEDLGGGGHRNAAGAYYPGTLEELKSRLAISLVGLTKAG